MCTYVYAEKHSHLHSCRFVIANNRRRMGKWANPNLKQTMQLIKLLKSSPGDILQKVCHGSKSVWPETVKSRCRRATNSSLKSKGRKQTTPEP